RPSVRPVWCGRIWLLLGATVRRLFRDADAGVCTDRVVDRVPVGGLDRWRQRHSRSLAGTLGSESSALLLAFAWGCGVGDRGASDGRILAVWFCVAGDTGFAAAS